MGLFIISSHKLARELLNREDNIITASCGEREYVIEGVQLAKTHANYDDSTMHLNLILRESEGNIKR